MKIEQAKQIAETAIRQQQLPKASNRATVRNCEPISPLWRSFRNTTRCVAGSHSRSATFNEGDRGPKPRRAIARNRAKCSTNEKGLVRKSSAPSPRPLRCQQLHLAQLAPILVSGCRCFSSGAQLQTPSNISNIKSSTIASNSNIVANSRPERPLNAGLTSCFLLRAPPLEGGHFFRLPRSGHAYE